jgi:hypothetical protein
MGGCARADFDGHEQKSTFENRIDGARAHHRRPNRSASEIKSKPRRSLRSQFVKYGFFGDKVERFRLKSGSLPPTDSSSYNV